MISNSVLHLLDEAVVLCIIAEDVLKSVDLMRLGIADSVDDTTRTFSQPLQNLIVEELLSHELMSIPENVYNPDPAGRTAGRGGSPRVEITGDNESNRLGAKRYPYKNFLINRLNNED